MASLFEDVKNGIRDGIELVVDKTEEYGKIGMLQIDILGVKRSIEKLFAELGGQAYDLLSKDEKSVVAKDPEVVRMVAELKLLEEKLDEKKNEIKKVRDEKEHERKERGETRKKEKAGAETKAEKVTVEDDKTSINKSDIEDANIVE